MHSIFIVFVLTISLAQGAHEIPPETQFLWSRFVNVSSDVFTSSVLPSYSNFDDFSHLSHPCRSALFQAIDGALNKRQVWALSLFNSWGKFPPSGLLQGTLTDFGDYDQCLDRFDGQNQPNQYCLVNFALPMPRPQPKSHNFYHNAEVLPKDHEINNEDLAKILNNASIYRHFEKISSIFYYEFVQVGICLPSECSNQDVEDILHKNTIKYGLDVGKFSCQIREEQTRLNPVQLSAIIFILAILILSVAGFIYDHMFAHKNSTLNILLWFSPIRNLQRLVRINSPEKSNDDDLACLHGLRIVTLFIIIIGHALDWNALNMFRNTFNIRDRVSELHLQPLYRGQLTVDTFFYISGLLTSYITIKYTGGEYRKFSYVKYLLLRYLRLTPQLGAFILISFLLPKMFDGPVWGNYIDKVDRCYENWWLNVAYVQNLFDIGNICALHSWFLAADMQLHWLALLPTALLLKNRRNALIVLQAIILCTILWSGITVYRQKLPPGAIITAKNDFLDEYGMPSDYLKFCYQPLTHAYVFFIGFLFGDYIATNGKELKKVKLSQKAKYGLWMLVFAGYLFTIYSMVPWLYGRAYQPAWSAVIFPVNLLIWSLVLTLMIWLCITGNGGPVGWFLSAKFFQPLSRMTYSVYLTHVWVLWIALGTRRELIDHSMSAIVLLLLSIVLVSFMVGSVFTVLVENPVIHAMNLFKKNLTDDDRKPNLKADVFRQNPVFIPMLEVRSN